MPQVKLQQFGGELPAWDKHLLPDGQAATAINTYLFSGSLTGWRKPKHLRDLVNPAARFAYRIPTVAETQAIAYFVFVTLPINGDTLTVGEIIYTWRTALASGGQPQEILIGADHPTCARNLIAALTADNDENTNAGVWYGTNTVSNGDVKFYKDEANVLPGLTAPQTAGAAIGATTYQYVVVGSIDFGAAYNLVKVAESTGGVRTVWLFDLLALTHTTATYTGGSNPSFDNDIAGAATWLEFDDPDTDVIKSPVVDDQFNRYYFGSSSQPPKYNTYQRIVAGQPAWTLGVPPPGCAPILSVTGGGNNLTLGNYTPQGGSLFGKANNIYLTKFTTPGDTQIQDVQFRLSEGGGAQDNPLANFAAVIYEDNNGVPGSLLNTGNIVQGTRAGEPNQSAFQNPTNLLNHTDYWLGFMIDTEVLLESGPAGGAFNTYEFQNTFTNGPPATAPTVPEGALADQPGLNMWGDFITSDVIEARSYVYTWVSEYSEEGPPSPPIILDGWSNGVWTLTLWTPPDDDRGVQRDLKKINIYRTVTGSGGTAAFFYVDTVDIGVTSYVDTKPDNEVALNDQMSSTNWFPPPEALQGLTVMPNGILAGFKANEIWFCEPYHAHAWPPAYVLTVDFPIVGLGVTNGALVVCTAATPYVITGNAPGAMAQFKCSASNPCLSRGSILHGDAAVTYMSPNGLIQVTSQGVATNTTDLWFTRENWQQLTPQKYARAIYLASCYFAMGSVSPITVSPSDVSQAQRGFTIELDQDNTSFTIWPQPGGHRLGFNELLSPTADDIQNIFTDPWTGIGMLISDGALWYFDFTDPLPVMQTYTWRSKIYQQNNKRNYEAMKVFFTAPPGTPALNPDPIEAEKDDPIWNTLPADRWGFIKTYVDVDGTGNLTLISAREIRKPGALLRLPSGFKAEQWQWEITARVIIANAQIATTAKELANV